MVLAWRNSGFYLALISVHEWNAAFYAKCTCCPMAFSWPRMWLSGAWWAGAGKKPKKPFAFWIMQWTLLMEVWDRFLHNRTVGIISLYVSKVNRYIYLLIMAVFMLITWFCFINPFILNFQSKRNSLHILFQKHYYRGTKINIKKGE